MNKKRNGNNQQNKFPYFLTAASHKVLIENNKANNFMILGSLLLFANGVIPSKGQQNAKRAASSVHI